MSSHDLPALNATAASLLGFLHKGPKTGWDLVCAVEASVGYFWNVTRSQVYRELKTLAIAGLVTEKASGARDKGPYAITAAGRAAFDAWISRPPGPEILRLPIVLTVFFGRHVDPALMQRYLDQARLDHLTRLEHYIQLRPQIEDEFHRTALDLGIAYEKTVLAWIEGLPWSRADSSKPRRRPKRET